jgi:hypothetical protein
MIRMTLHQHADHDHDHPPEDSPYARDEPFSQSPQSPAIF